MQIGYMRISKGEQTTALQEDALAKALVERTYRDVMSGVRDDRPQFQAMLDFARPGDTIVVWRLDRLGRSLKHLIETVMGLQARGINFRSLTEHVDTSTPGGKFTFHLFGALAEMERDVIRQRTKAGLEAARARGRIGGRPALHLDARKLQRARELYEKQEMSVAEIMALTGFASRYSSISTWFTRDRMRFQQTRRKKDKIRPRDAKMKTEKRNRRGASLVISHMK
jgi:DNA invertase Pin-like site-specific DNA recombinase